MHAPVNARRNRMLRSKSGHAATSSGRKPAVVKKDADAKMPFRMDAKNPCVVAKNKWSDTAAAAATKIPSAARSVVSFQRSRGLRRAQAFQ